VQVGNSWLASQGMATGLISTLQKTNQFTVLVVCQPPKSAGPVGAIVSIAPSEGRENLGINHSLSFSGTRQSRCLSCRT
jgi:hypothetical protein